jgi:tripartite-type tricarboxylate transporter receptor subunit TctC
MAIWTPYRRRTTRHTGHGVLRHVTAAVGIAALLLTACGGSGDPGAASTATDAESPAGSPDTEAAGGDKTGFYEGKSVELVVPFGTGGGTDTTARFLGSRLSEHIPGDPSIQVVNIPGGGSVTGFNEFILQREADGTNWGFSSGSTHLPFIFGNPAVRYDFNELAPVLATSVGNVVLVREGAGVETPADLVDAGPLVWGGESPVGSDTTQLLGLELLGIEYNPIFGFEEGPQRIALEQGEIDLMYNTTPAFLGGGGQDLVDRGVARVLYTAGQLRGGEVVRDPAFPDVPTVAEVYEEIHGESPSGPEWEAYKALLGATVTFSKVLWLHGDAPDEAIATARAAANDMAATEGFYDEAEEVIGPYELTLEGQGLSADVRSAFEIAPDTIAWLTDWLQTTFDVDIDET